MIFYQNEEVITGGKTWNLGRRREGGSGGEGWVSQDASQARRIETHTQRDRAQERNSGRGDLDNWPSVRLLSDKFGESKHTCWEGLGAGGKGDDRG